jgi:4-amino-4-deoxy-L-arabinose transferase-like glycosyltransferase
LTVDEAYHWFDRVETFLAALEQGDYASTNIIGHPGVTTLWLGTVGRLAHLLLFEAGYIPHADSNPFLYWSFLRVPVGVVCSLCVALAYPLLRIMLVDRRVALLATLLWAAEPFLVAHSQLLHLDALLTSFVMLSLLAALAAFPPASRQHASSHPAATPHPARSIRWPLLVASAVVGGLAFLTKSPSVILLPMIGMVVLLSLVMSGMHPKNHADVPPRLLSLARWRQPLLTHTTALIVWGSIAAFTWFVLWPSAWVDLADTIGRVIRQARYDGGSPHGWGNFFLGRAIDRPGPLFYPVALVLRMSPWLMVGLFAAAAVALLRFWRVGKGGQQHTPRRWTQPSGQPSGTMPVLGVFTLFALLFLLMMTIPPKKFDRYILPVFPSLTIIAAFGLVQGYDMVRSTVRERNHDHDHDHDHEQSPAHHHRTSAPLLRGLTWVAVGGGLAFNLLWYHPYELAYYNPLLGGGATASWAIPVGWGEGYEQAGAFISAQPNGCDRAVASWFAPVLRHFLCNHWVVSLNRVFEPGKVDYAVLYIDQIQRRNEAEATAYLFNNFARIHTVKIHGIEYAYVYQLPLPNAHRVMADFGPAIRLLGYDVDTSEVRSRGTIRLTLQWMPRAPIEEDYSLFVHVLDSQGNRVGQIDVPPGGPRAPTSGWKLNGYVTWIHPVPVPADLPTGTYWLSLGVYHPDNFARLPVQGPAQAGAPDDGANVLMLEPVYIQ